MLGRVALAAALWLVWAPLAHADSAPLVVFHSATDAREARAALEATAARNGTGFLDVSPRAEAPPRASQLLSRAIDAYHDLRYEAALARIGEALTEAQQTGAAGLSATDLSDLFVYRGLVLTEQGNASGAWDELVRAATIDPTRKLDPVRFPPRVAEAFQRAIDAVGQGSKSSVTVAVPTACRAWLDGRSLAPNTPVRTSTGEHFVRVECEGSRPYGARVVVSEPEQVLRPTLVEHRPVSLADAAALASRRGATWLIVATVTASPDAAATLHLQLVEAATVASKDSVVVSVDGDVAAAAQRLIDLVVNPPPPIVGPIRAEPTPWYRKPWVWGVAGAAVATAVLLPLVLDSDAPAAFDVVPELP